MQPVDERGRGISRLLEGRYEVLGLLGRGGFASVYQVRNLRLQRLEALKVVAGTHEEGSEFRQRFEQEARVAASLEHPNILKVYDFGHDAGTLWYSMPFVDGPTLRAELARRGTFDEEAAVRILVPLLDALEYSHGRGVIHRDIKPDNILLDRRDRPYLMDFGIAKTDDSLVKTQTGLVLGSPAYISPEQLRGERLDGRTDIYSLGVSLFQMVAGAAPFRSDRMADLADRLVVDAPRLSLRKRDVSPELERIVARSLARSRDERYAGAREMRQDLEAFLDALRAPPAAPARESADLEDTASVHLVPLPPIAVPAPPPDSPSGSRSTARRVSSAETVPPAPPTGPTGRRVSSISALPTEPAPRLPVPERAPSPVTYEPAPGPAAPEPVRPPSGPGPGLRRAALLGAGLAVVLLAFGTAFFITRRGTRPEAGPAAAPLKPTAAPAPVPTAAPPAPTAAPLPTVPVAAATPPPPLATAAAPTPARAAAAPRRTARPTPSREAAAAPAPPARRIVTPPDVDEIAAVALSPDQQRACSGQVVGVSVVVGQDGRLLSKRVISPVSPVCDALALEVLSRYRFHPARDEKGVPVEGRFAFTVQF